jgi:hypothetical protein
VQLPKSAQEVLPVVNLVLQRLQEALAFGTGPWDRVLGWPSCPRLQVICPVVLLLSSFYFTPRNGYKIRVNIYIYIIRMMENLCHYTPEPPCPNHSELGLWGLG